MAKKSFAEMYVEEKEKLEKENPQVEESSIEVIDTIEKLKKEIEKYSNNEIANFSNVKWEKLRTKILQKIWLLCFKCKFNYIMMIILKLIMLMMS